MTPSSKSPGLDTARRNYPLLVKRLERLMEIGQVLSSTLEIRKLLRRIIEAACELTDTEAASVMLFDPRTNELRFEATTNIPEGQFEAIAVPLEGSIAGWIFNTAEPLIVPDTRQDPRWHQNVDDTVAFVTRSILGVPMIARDKKIGVIEAINKRRGTFTDDDVTTLKWLCTQAAIAIVNARLFEQSDMVAAMVHDLRTPLNALMASSHLLLHPSLPDASRHAIVKTMQAETQRLSHMTTEFLDFAKLESGRMTFTLEPFNLVDLAHECLSVVQMQAHERDIALTLRAADQFIPSIESDYGKVKQVLLNLLTNAIKYNRPAGNVTVMLDVEEAKQTIKVVDTGPGIPPEAMGRMFEKFYRVPGSEKQAAGTGLGLAIAKLMIETLGGELGVESTVGVGSAFYFRLPLVPRRTGALA
jgi:signal transduction histidine kinase